MKSIANTIIASVALSSLGLSQDFLAPFTHIHASESGTPYVHSFGIEPAFTGRDLFFDQSYISGDGFNAHATELELEWAFTKRLGIIAEVSYLWLDQEGVGSSSGFGDLAIVPRALLIDTDRFLLTAQIETELPTGSSTFGGDTAIAPGIATWFDLGNDFTLNSIISVEHGFDADETELVYGLGFVKSFGNSHAGHDHDHGHDHFATAGLFHLHLEVTGTTPVNGPEGGDINLEALVGVSYGVTQNLDIRAGYFFPITSPNEFDYGVTGGLILHF